MSNIISSQFTHKFAPKDLQFMVLPQRIKNLFKDKTIQMNHLFYSSPGTGKSTLAKLIGQNYQSYYYVNVPRDGGVDALRDDSSLYDFCSQHQVSFDDTKQPGKVVIFDEMNDASTKWFEALKGFMDSFPNVKFIGTTNHLEKVPEAVASRFHKVNFNCLTTEEETILKKNYIARIEGVMKKLQIEYNQSAIDKILEYFFPDFRSALQKLQEFHIMGVKSITSDNIAAAYFDFKELYDVILKGDLSRPEKIHELLNADYASKASDVLYGLESPFIRYIKDTKPQYIPVIPHVLINVAKYINMLPTLNDQSIGMKACIMEIMFATSKIQD